MGKNGRQHRSLREPLLPPTSLDQAALADLAAEGEEEPENSRLCSWKPLLGISSAGLAAFLVIALAALGLLALSVADRQPPLCRKSAALGVVAGGLKGSNNQSLELLVWSGMARHRTPLSDLHGFDITRREWHSLHESSGGDLWQRLTTRRPQPLPRWKAGAVQTGQGLVVFGGDGYPPAGRHTYLDDLWLLRSHSLSWRKAKLGGAAGAVPSARRAHSTVLYRDAEGRERLVVFGGRRHDHTLLNDAWESTLSWPNVTWRRIGPSDGAHVPGPRKGHSAVLVGDAETPQMLVYGGRDDKDYFGDLWLLDIAAGEWRQLQPQGPRAPPRRDHHGAAYFRGRLFIHGGRSGATYQTSGPLGDLWTFDLASLTWQEVPQAGAGPLPRFLHSYVQYTPPGSADARLVVFGGETLSNCRLNDVWELNLGTRLWLQLSPPAFCSRRCARAF